MKWKNALAEELRHGDLIMMTLGDDPVRVVTVYRTEHTGRKCYVVRTLVSEGGYNHEEDNYIESGHTIWKADD